MVSATRLILAVLASAVVLPAAQAAPPADLCVRVALADWVVRGGDGARYWLGPVQSEVLTRRLRLYPNLLLTEPFLTRQDETGVAVDDAQSLLTKLQPIADKHAAPYVLSGIIEDRGETLVVQPIALTPAKEKNWLGKPVEVTLASVFEPQVDQIVKQFLRQIGIRLSNEMIDVLTAYDAKMPFEALELLGDGWRAWSPDAPKVAYDKWAAAAKIAPDSSLAQEASSQAALAERRRLLETARERCIAQVADRPSDPYAYYQLALVHADAGSWSEAVVAYQRALGIRPTFVDARLGLGVAMMQMGDNAGAIKQFSDILLLEPNNLKTIYNLGLANLRIANTKSAIDFWTLGRSLYPNEQLFRTAIEQVNRSGGSPAVQGLQP